MKYIAHITLHNYQMNNLKGGSDIFDHQISLANVRCWYLDE
jgi:hypothetical protein